MPDIEGTELLERLKETEPKILKIIVTGYASLQNAIDAVNKGADGHVLKPFDASELLAMIKKRLKKQKESMKCNDKKVAEYIETRVKQMNSKNGRVEFASAFGLAADFIAVFALNFRENVWQNSVSTQNS